MRRWITMGNMGRTLWVVMVGSLCLYLSIPPTAWKWWETITVFFIASTFVFTDRGRDTERLRSRRLEMLDREIERLERLQEETRKEKAKLDARIERLLAVLHIVLEWDWDQADLAVDVPFLTRLMETALKDDEQPPKEKS
jgi:hypothetical protein